MSPNTVAFGSVPIGQTASTTISILNSGSTPVQIAQLNLSGQPFSIVGASSLPVTLAAGATYSLNLKFNPAAAGTATGQLTIASNSSTASAPVVNLLGTGTTGAASATLGTLYCSSGTLTGSGTDACTVTLTSPAPSTGLVVNLSSSSSAVAVPSTVTVPANMTSAGFTATISSVAAAQVVTMTASAGSISKNFTLQLNAALLALSINATNVAFGDVVVNTAATQSVTLTSTGTAPVTISGAKLTGTGFTLSGSAPPTTLNPNQQATLYIQFNPLAVGAAAGQLTITSNSSTNSTAVISLSGTGTAPTQPVAVALTPATASATVGGNQQFAASVTGTSNTAVTWAASGAGCSGASCGTISATGLYTAPAAVPSPATVTITATSVADSSKFASANVTILQHASTTYYLAPAANGGSDSNSGTDAAHPWLTPNHNITAPSIIIAAASTAYSYTQFERTFGTCTSSNGDICWLSCEKFDGCKVSNSAANRNVFDVNSSYWGVQNWECSATAAAGACFNVQPQGSASIHHVVFANNVVNGSGTNGISAANKGGSTAVSFDYIAILGNWVYNAAQNNTFCFSGISIYEPLAYDTAPGTHIYIAGNLSNDNVDPNPCFGGTPSDGEGVILDSLNYGQAGGTPYTQQVVVDNNYFMFNGFAGIEVGGSGNSAPVYVRHNTQYGNDTANNQNATWCGDTSIDQSSNVQYFGNLVKATPSISCGAGANLSAIQISRSDATNSLYGNFLYAVSGTTTAINSSNGFTAFGPNNIIGTDPNFANPVDPGAPSCGAASSVPNCFASVVANFTPTVTAAKAYGYQIPSTTNVSDPLYPKWLCSVTNLPTGLVTPGC